eukprot:8760859-Pyramimonas_sp.AAC.1
MAPRRGARQLGRQAVSPREGHEARRHAEFHQDEIIECHVGEHQVEVVAGFLVLQRNHAHYLHSFISPFSLSSH